jgi:hypothetical protein
MSQSPEDQSPTRRAFLSGAALSIAGASASAEGAVQPAESARATPADLIGIRAPGANSVSRLLSDKLGEVVSVLDKGASGNGIDDDTPAFDRAIADAAAGSTIWLPPGRAYRLNGANLDGKRLSIDARGATIMCGGVGALLKSDHDNKLSIEGGRWTGAGSALRWIAPTTSRVDPLELLVVGGEYHTTGYAFHLDGVRESSFHGIEFKHQGVYRTRSVNHSFIGCVWQTCDYAINDDGDGSPASAGLTVIGGTMIGCAHGVRSVGTDYVGLLGLMCDYNDAPARFEGVERVAIHGGYYSSRTTTPALYAGRRGNEPTRDLYVSGAEFVQHERQTPNSCVELYGVECGVLTAATLSFFTLHGVRYENCTDLTIDKSRFASDPAASAAVRCIYEPAGSTGGGSNRIVQNAFQRPAGPMALSVSEFTTIAGNRGYVTENRGLRVAPAGAAFVDIEHGCHYVPTKDEIGLTWGNAEAAANPPYIEAIGPSVFRLVFPGPLRAAAEIAWRVRKRTMLA